MYNRIADLAYELMQLLYDCDERAYELVMLALRNFDEDYLDEIIEMDNGV